MGASQQEWLDRLETEHANLRAALAWFSGPRGDDLGAALRLAAACSWFWWYRRHFAEGRAILESLLARQDAESHGTAWAGALSGLGQLAQAQGDFVHAARLHETAVAAWRRLGDPGRLATCSFSRGPHRCMRAQEERFLY